MSRKSKKGVEEEEDYIPSGSENEEEESGSEYEAEESHEQMTATSEPKSEHEKTHRSRRISSRPQRRISNSVYNDEDEEYEGEEEEYEDKEPLGEDDDSKRDYGYNDLTVEELSRGLEIADSEDWIGWNDSWHDHREWQFVTKQKSRHKCSTCGERFAYGDLISLGKRLIEIPSATIASTGQPETQIKGIKGVDRVHWKCSKFFARKPPKKAREGADSAQTASIAEPAPTTTTEKVASNWSELVQKVIGGVEALRQIPGFSAYPLEKQISLIKEANLPIPSDLENAQKEQSRKRKREFFEKHSLDDLDTLPFRDLQRLARENNIKAGQKKVDLVAQLKQVLSQEI